MAKGKKPTSKIAKGAKGRKNHGPKRHLNHDIFPKALRITIGRQGGLTKFYTYDSFCLALAARGVRTNTHELWKEYCLLKAVDCTNDRPKGTPEGLRKAQINFFTNIQAINLNLMKKGGKGA